MLLRNKKTGEIETVICSFYYESDNGEMNEEIEMEVSSLAELNEEWEDYKPKEPLIKDEKIREAVKNWASTNYKNHMIIEFDSDMNGFYMFMDNTDRSLCSITFQPDIELGLKEREYIITELCGGGE